VQGFLFQPWPEGLLSQDKAQRLMAQYADRFSQIWRDAWGIWEQGIAPELRSYLRPSTRSGIIHDAAVARAREILAEDEGIEFCKHLGFAKIYVEGIAVIRLKRVGRDHLAKNIKTRQQRRWYAHKPIDGVRDDVTRLTVGYTLNATQTDLDRIVVSLQYGLKDLVYSFFLDEAAGEMPAITPMPSQPLPPETKPVVRAKGKGVARKAKEQ
jgi:hypothetical protein